jgi:DHA1 family multidrug resistance protein-like MFS transporter
MSAMDRSVEVAKTDVELSESRLGSQHQDEKGESDPVLQESQNHSAKLDEKDETTLNWIRTHETQVAYTVGATKSSESSVLMVPAEERKKAYPPGFLGQNEYLVEFDGADDPAHPQNWSSQVKLVSTHINEKVGSLTDVGRQSWGFCV